MNTVAVTGGAGYIGSFISKCLAERGFRPHVIDNLSTGFESNIRWGEWTRHDLSDPVSLSQLLSSINATALIHVAGSISVEESSRNPGKYYLNNVVNSLNVFEACRLSEVKNIIFSSTAAVYKTSPVQVNEDSVVWPISNYGKSKAMSEQMLRSYADSYGLRCLVFRYFNAAGANTRDNLGDLKPFKTHLIATACERAIDGGVLKIFGDDYDTRDGSAVRDYIHVEDIARAHAFGLERMLNGAVVPFQVLNLATGSGTTVKEIVSMVDKTSWSNLGVRLKWETAPRRDGDVDSLVADPTRAMSELDWKPLYSTEEIINSSLLHSISRKHG